MNLSEAEIQVLVSIEEANYNGLNATKNTLEERSERYWVFKEDWSDAYNSLVSKELINCSDGIYQLTDSGRPLAVNYFAERPDLYWYYYQKFFDLVARSKIHSRFCEIVFGEDWSQEGQTDMECLDDLLSRMSIQSGQHILDLGCGAGGLSEYIHDKYDTSVTGIDYSESAIRTAIDRTQSKREKLKFLQTDLNALNLSANSYDVAISIDSIYWVADVDKTIMSIMEIVKQGGLIGILIEHRLEGEKDISFLDSKHSRVGRSLDNLKLEYETVDYSELFLKFWPRVKKTAISLREKYVTEGTELVCDNWIREADNDYLPSVESNEIRRYFFLVHV